MAAPTATAAAATTAAAAPAAAPAAALHRGTGIDKHVMTTCRYDDMSI